MSVLMVVMMFMVMFVHEMNIELHAFDLGFLLSRGVKW